MLPVQLRRDADVTRLAAARTFGLGWFVKAAIVLLSIWTDDTEVTVVLRSYMVSLIPAPRGSAKEASSSGVAMISAEDPRQRKSYLINQFDPRLRTGQR